jgi:glycosyltransferase involved in cell wall biosynthesis
MQAQCDLRLAGLAEAQSQRHLPKIDSPKPAMPTVDLITPTFRRSALLPQFFAALAAQTFKDFRLILVNDDPAQSLAGLVDDWRYQLDILLVEPGVNQRAAAARNAGLKEACALYIALCDDDDLWLPQHLENTVGLLQSDAADFVYAACDLVLTEHSQNGRREIERQRFAFAPDVEFLRRWNLMPISGVVYRRALHDELGDFDASIAHYADWDWNLRVAMSGARMALSPQTTVEILFDQGGDNQSGDPLNMASELPHLIAKHQLGALPSANFRTMLAWPEVASRRL